MDLGLTGRVAIVAAASKGLGRAVAEELAREGAHVAICARTPSTLAETAAHIAPTARRVLAPLDEAAARELRARILQKLNR